MLFGKISTGSTKFRLFLLVLVVTAAAGCERSSAGAEGNDSVAASDQRSSYPEDLDKASYSLGYTLAENVTQRFTEGVNVAAFIQGVEDKFTDKTLAISEEEASAALQVLAQRQHSAMNTKAEENLAAGLAFLEQNATREEVTSLPSGLQYEILTAAQGAKPAATDTVTTHYHGTLVDGTVFDSSYERGQPASFPVNGVISGWTEALQLMAVGAKWRLFLPPVLAYGKRGQGSISPNSTLIFDVELMAIN